MDSVNKISVLNVEGYPVVSAAQILLRLSFRAFCSAIINYQPTKCSPLSFEHS